MATEVSNSQLSSDSLEELANGQQALLNHPSMQNIDLTEPDDELGLTEEEIREQLSYTPPEGELLEVAISGHVSPAFDAVELLNHNPDYFTEMEQPGRISATTNSVNFQAHSSGARPKISTQSCDANRSVADNDSCHSLASSNSAEQKATSTAMQCAPDGNSVSSSAYCQDIDGIPDIPIVGYEIVERKDKITVYKVKVCLPRSNPYYIFRRYSEFSFLNERLQTLFPLVELGLPSKRFIGNNFSTRFITERLHGLQCFLNNVIFHKDVFASVPVQTFLCLDDPPGPYDSLEESRAQCDTLENQVYNMKLEMRDQTDQIMLLNDELALKNAEIEALQKILKNSNQPSQPAPSSLSCESDYSLPEDDQCHFVTAELPSDNATAANITWDVPPPTAPDKTISNGDGTFVSATVESATHFKHCSTPVSEKDKIDDSTNNNRKKAANTKSTAKKRSSACELQLE